MRTVVSTLAVRPEESCSPTSPTWPSATRSPAAEITVDRARLVRYAGASGDFNPIHWNDRVATSVGLPGVIAHGMWTMGAAVERRRRLGRRPGRGRRLPGALHAPGPRPGPGCGDHRGDAVVGALDPEAGTARIDLTVAVDGSAVLGKAQALVRLS